MAESPAHKERMDEEVDFTVGNTKNIWRNQKKNLKQGIHCREGEKNFEYGTKLNKKYPKFTDTIRDASDPGDDEHYHNTRTTPISPPGTVRKKNHKHGGYSRASESEVFAF